MERPPAVNLMRIEEEMSAVHLRLTGVGVENLPWDEYLQRYDSPETFFYVDPPYWGSEHYYGKDLFARDDYARMAGQLTGIRGKFLLSLNDVAEIRDIFSGFSIRSAETVYTCGREGAKRAGEILIMNYEPNMGLLGVGKPPRLVTQE